MPRIITHARPIRAVYYKDFKATKVVKITKGKDPENMVSLCQKHMRRNDYEAMLAEVYNDQGKLFGVIKRNIAGDEITMLFEETFKEKKDGN
jgi:uncharacterized phage-associated protein